MFFKPVTSDSGPLLNYHGLIQLNGYQIAAIRSSALRLSWSDVFDLQFSHLAWHVLLALISNITTRNIIQLCHNYKMQLKMIVLVQKCSLIQEP